MDRSAPQYDAYVQILKEELVPAMGCTEPIALAYAAAKAKEVLGQTPDRVEVGASGSVIKNVKSVIVPNTGQLKGIPAAIAAGIVAGCAEKELEVISDASKEDRKRIKKYMDTTPIEVFCIDPGAIFEIKVTVFAGKSDATVRITGYHTNIVRIERNGEILLDAAGGNVRGKREADRSLLSVKGIVDFAETVALEDVEEVLQRQISFNMAIAEEGLRGDYGANIGKVCLKAYGNDVKSKMKAMAAAGSDARMSGCGLPVIINSGSGNQGITASVPVIVYARENGLGEEALYRALTVSNLVAIHLKTGIGTLSAYCGAVSAGAAAGAGIAYLNGGRGREIYHTIVNALAIESGMICDGAKASCAAKIAVAVDAGILGYDMYRYGQQFYGGEGIVEKGVENTIHNIGRIGKEGMKETNKEIIQIMIGK